MDLGCRCIEEEGHDTGVGTPHRYVGVEGALPVTAEQAAAELSTRLGIPCTVVGVGAADDGDVTCAQADGTPEGAAMQLGALWRPLPPEMAAMCGDRRAFQERQAERVVKAIVGYLRESERDWEQLNEALWEPEYRDAIAESKQLHDAQVAELLERIGGAL